MARKPACLPQVDEDFRAAARDREVVNVLRLLMVDDHLMLTEALSARLSEVADVWVVGRCATDDPQLPALVDRLRPDVVTVDVDPVRSTGDLVESVRTHRPAVHVVVLTGGLDPQRAVDAARAGAAGWVPKECGVDELTTVLRGVCRGHAWYPPELLGEVLRGLRADVVRAARRDGPLDVLSDRELDVLRGMVEGKRGSRIAAELRISAETVRTHTRSILAKLRVHSQLEAVSVAAAAGLRAPGQPGDSGEPDAPGRSNTSGSLDVPGQLGASGPPSTSGRPGAAGASGEPRAPGEIGTIGRPSPPDRR
ncbi:response regulator transcription factor [Saccharopolyspora gregorii]|uniref:Response regulator transcription factor n=1 Tax=Saccharopolyspora gregorii TaxID=33914 RepID=A0ABP6RR51_9PSEU